MQFNVIYYILKMYEIIKSCQILQRVTQVLQKYHVGINYFIIICLINIISRMMQDQSMNDNTEQNQIQYRSYKGLLQILSSLNSVRVQKFFNHFISNLDKINAGQTFDETNLSDFFHYDKVITPSNLCGKILESGTAAFRCIECMNEQNSIICLDCFDKSDHKGHNFQKISVYGGCCDCGDDQKWKDSGSCINHVKKNEKIFVNQQQTSTFIKEMKFVFYVFLRGYYIFDKKKFAQQRNYAVVELSNKIVNFLSQFNKESAVSNEMTYRMLTECYDCSYSDISSNLQDSYNEAIKIQGKNLLHLIFRTKDLKNLELKITEIYTLMFTCLAFKKELTIEYSKALIEVPEILNSDFSHISCQIYTSHRLLRQLIEQQKLPPLDISNAPKKLKFEQIANIYVRFYIDVAYLSRLYNGTGKIYLNYQFTKGSIMSLIKYYDNTKLAHCKDQCITYYGIQDIYLKYFMPMLKTILSEKQLLKKMMLDITHQILSQNQPLNTKVYLSKERTFILCLFAYCDGDITKTLDFPFLQQIGVLEDPIPQNLTYKSVILKMFVNVVHIFQLYATFLSNRQTADRFYTFYSFSFLKKFTLVSIDFILMKFCILVLKKLNVRISLFSDTFKKAFTKLQSILKNGNFTINYEERYDRKKALGIWSDFIGLLGEVSYLDHSEINLKCKLSIASEEEVQHFYCQLLASVEPIKVDEFKHLCEVFVGDQPLYFQQFVKKCAKIEDKKFSINRNTQFTKKVVPMDLSYLKSKKKTEKLTKMMGDNSRVLEAWQKKLNQGSINRIHTFLPSPSSTCLINLRNTIFSDYFLEIIQKSVAQYFERVCEAGEQVILNDMPNFLLFVQEILRIYHIIKKTSILETITKIVLGQKASVFNRFISSKLKNNLLLLSEQVSKSMKEDELQKSQMISQQQGQKKARMREAKLVKMEKFKKKKETAIQKNFKKFQNEFIEEQFRQNEGFKMQQIQDEEVCMLCKLGEEDLVHNSLGLLCYMQKSNIITKDYLNIRKLENPNSFYSSYMATSCQHFIHKQCYSKIYGDRDYIFCNLCKNSCNMLLLKESQEKFTFLVSKYLNQTYDLVLEQQYIDEEEEQEHQQEIAPLDRIELALALTEMCENQQQNKELQSQMVPEQSQQQKQRDNFLKKQACELQQKLSIEEKMMDSLVTTVLYKLLADSSETFERSQVKTCAYILTNLRNIFISRLNKETKNKSSQLFKELMKQSKNPHQILTFSQGIQQLCIDVLQKMFKKLTRIMTIRFLLNDPEKDTAKIGTIQEIKMFRSCYKYAFLTIMRKILIIDKDQTLSKFYEQKGEQMMKWWQNSEILTNQTQMQSEGQLYWDKNTIRKAKKIPQVLLDSIETIVDSISAEKNKVNEKVEEIKILNSMKPYRPFRMIDLPENLSLLSEQIGQCSYCLRVTNQNSICLLCQGSQKNINRYGFKSCIGCSVHNLTKHAIDYHGGSSVFIRADTGVLIFLGGGQNKKKSWAFNSLYENFLLEPYNAVASNSINKKEDKTRFYLDQKEYERIEKNIVVRHRIQQQIRYMEATKNRSNYGGGLNKDLNKVY